VKKDAKRKNHSVPRHPRDTPSLMMAKPVSRVETRPLRSTAKAYNAAVTQKILHMRRYVVCGPRRMLTTASTNMIIEKTASEMTKAAPAYESVK
jgi:hypothetical protein